ncbi:hypothetical protein NPIL_173631, partial [Nephila pilipes]
QFSTCSTIIGSALNGVPNLVRLSHFYSFEVRGRGAVQKQSGWRCDGSDVSGFVPINLVCGVEASSILRLQLRFRYFVHLGYVSRLLLLVWGDLLNLRGYMEIRDVIRTIGCFP